jgi:hypothetical protein
MARVRPRYSPASATIIIHPLGSAQAKDIQISSVELIGSDAKVQFHQTDEGLDVQLPGQAPGKYAYALKISVWPTQ